MTQSPNSMKKLNHRIQSALLRLGIPVVQDGFRYLNRLVQLVYDDPGALELVTKILYPRVAKEFGVKSGSVACAAMRSIHCAYRDCGGCMPADYFDEDGKPLVTSVFIARTAEKLRGGEF